MRNDFLNRVISPLKANVAAAVVLGLFLTEISKDGDSLERVFESPFTCFVWMIVLFLATIYPIPRTRGRTPISLVPAIILAAICIVGAAAACWFAVLSRFAANTATKWKPVSLSTWRVSQAAVSVGIAGWFYETMGGRIQDGVF